MTGNIGGTNYTLCMNVCSEIHSYSCFKVRGVGFSVVFSMAMYLSIILLSQQGPPPSADLMASL